MKYEITKTIRRLTDKDNNIACAAMKELQKISENENSTYEFIDYFIEMVGSTNSYVRTRGLTLIAENARWDINNKINLIIDELLEHIVDAKPITSRQFIKLIPIIFENKPELRDKIKDALIVADISGYKDSMRPLVKRDIENALEKCNFKS